jgi:hypothetical protein
MKYRCHLTPTYVNSFYIRIIVIKLHGARKPVYGPRYTFFSQYERLSFTTARNYNRQNSFVHFKILFTERRQEDKKTPKWKKQGILHILCLTQLLHKATLMCLCHSTYLNFAAFSKDSYYIYILFIINPSCILVTSRKTFNLIFSAFNGALVFSVTDVSA